MIHEQKARGAEPLSFTAFIAACLGKAVDEDKSVQAYRKGRNQLVIFQDVDISIMPTVNSSMQGKICMVTGANSGIGKATALALAQMGATVVMGCRDRASAETAKRRFPTTTKN